MSKEELDLYGAVGYLAIFAGQWMIGNRNIWGWWFRIGGDMVWAILGVYLGLYSIIIFSLAGIVIDGRGFFSWKRDPTWDL